MKCATCGHLKESHALMDGPCIAWGYVDGEDGKSWVCACRVFVAPE